MRPLRKRPSGWALVLLSVPLGLTSIALGWTFDGILTFGVRCSRGPFPEVGSPFPESGRITGEPTLLLLGVNCTYDAGGHASARRRSITTTSPRRSGGWHKYERELFGRP